MSIRNDAAADDFTRTTKLPNLGSLTFMAWMRMNTVRVGNTYLIAVDNGGTEIALGTDADGVTVGLIVPVTPVFSATVLSAGKWFHAAMTMTPAGTAGYINGSRVITTAETLATIDSASIADGVTGASWFNGNYTAVKVWDRALAPQEIVEEMRQVTPVSLVGLNSWHACAVAGAAGIDNSNMGRPFVVTTALTQEDDPILLWNSKRIVRRLKKFANTSHYPGYYAPSGWY